jgi:hypothetical protein
LITPRRGAPRSASCSAIVEFRVRSSASLELELIALRHQVTVPQRQRRGRPRLSSLDRLLWLWLYWIWPQVIDAMVLVKPATVIHWSSTVLHDLQDIDTGRRSAIGEKENAKIANALRSWSRRRQREPIAAPSILVQAFDDGYRNRPVACLPRNHVALYEGPEGAFQEASRCQKIER